VHIKRIASYEDDNELLKHVDEALKCRKSTNESQRREVNENKLLQANKNLSNIQSEENNSDQKHKKQNNNFEQI
jgi:hypothetical protein